MREMWLNGIGLYMPELTQSAAEIARLSGIAEEVVQQKFGLVEKHVAGPDEHPADMAVAAARKALGGRSPASIDLVIYFGSPHKEYPVWLAAPKIQHELGAVRAHAFEVSAVSCGLPYALYVARGLMAADPSLHTVLLAGASRESHLIDYENERSRFMFNFGDGGAACVLSRRPEGADRRGPSEQPDGRGRPEATGRPEAAGRPEAGERPEAWEGSETGDHPGVDAHAVLQSAFITDGSFAEFVRVPAGGSVEPASEASVRGRRHFLDVTDPAAMKERLDPVSLKRFVRVVELAVERSGYSVSDIGFLAMLHTKRSLHLQVLRELGLSAEQSFYLERFGHMSAIDPLFALQLGEAAGRLRPGMLAVVLSAGTGYTWGATAIRW